MRQRGRMRSALSLGAAAVAVATAPGCHDEPCPERRYLTAVCATLGCRVAARFVGDPINAKLGPAEELVVPLTQFGDELRKTPDLHFDYAVWVFPDAASYPTPDPALATLTIDGVAGTHLQPSPERKEVFGLATTVHWEALPSAPASLTVRYDEGVPGMTVGIRAWFEDEACEDGSAPAEREPCVH